MLTRENNTLDSFRLDRQAPWSSPEPVPCLTETRPTCSIVIAALNEEASLPRLIEQIEALPGSDGYEVVLVDDGSDDATWSVIDTRVRRHPGWHGIRLSRPFGQQSALMAGLSVARGRAVITLDADGQQPVRCIPAMLEKWRDGATVVQMIRDESKDTPWLKRTTSRAFYRVFSLLCEVPIAPAAAEFRLLDRSVLDLILRNRGRTPFLRGLIPWLGCEVVEMPYVPQKRAAGETKYSFARMMRLAVHGLTSFSIVPLRLGIWAGLAFSVLAFAYLGYIAWVGLFHEAAVPGWASTAGLVALLGGVQLFCIGLVGEYLGRLYTVNLGRPPFVIRQLVSSSPDRTEPQRESEPMGRASVPAVAGRDARPTDGLGSRTYS